MTAMGALMYPDLSSAQAGMSLAGAQAVCVKITEGSTYVNPAAAAFKAQADAEGALLFSYHFLHAGSVAAQAAWCFGHNGHSVPLMVDCEPSGPSEPRLADLTRFIDAYRALGGICHLAYLPRWYWAAPPREGGLGSPSLQPLTERRMGLVSSDYLPYSDTGPGWEPYGGMTPGIWQWTAAAHWNGRPTDRNAFKGTLTQLRDLITTGSIIPVEPAAAAAEEDDMQLQSGAGAETIISLLRGSKTWVAFACDASRTRAPAPVLRVAVHSYSKGMSQVGMVTMPASGKHTVTFGAKDVDFLSVVREAGNGGDTVAVGYNYG
jgi:hypothetical protein